MASLKHRFPIYAKVMRLYPAAYYRKYATLMLQTLADLLDEPDQTWRQRLWRHTKAWADLWPSIILQRFLSLSRAYQQRSARIIRHNAIISLLLVAPLLTILLLARFEKPTTVLVPSFWYSRVVVDTWSIIMPILAALIAITTVIMWFITRSQARGKRSRRSVIWLSLCMLLALGGAGFVGLTSAQNYTYSRQLSRDKQLSLQYQQQHPTLACQLLPPQAAQQAAGRQHVDLLNMPNDPQQPHSGIMSEANGIQVSSCTYVPAKFTSFSLTAYVHQAQNPAAQQPLHDSFYADPYEFRPDTISLQGYSGFYTQYNDQSFDLRLWVKGYWLEVIGRDFTQANAAMKAMISNLNTRLADQVKAAAAAAQAKIPPQPITTDNLSATDRDRITDLVIQHDLQPTGTGYHLDFQTIAGQQVSGQFRYTNGIHGTFTAAKQNEIWTIINYQKQ